MSKSKGKGKGKLACPTCGVAWTDNLGLSGKKLERARRALKVVCTWAVFEDGKALIPEQVAKLCLSTLEETAP